MKPRPKVVWFQLGIKNEDAAKILKSAGITVVLVRRQFYSAARAAVLESLD